LLNLFIDSKDLEKRECNRLRIEKDAKSHKKDNIYNQDEPKILLFVNIVPNDITLRRCLSYIPIKYFRIYSFFRRQILHYHTFKMRCQYTSFNLKIRRKSYKSQSTIPSQLLLSFIFDCLSSLNNLILVIILSIVFDSLSTTSIPFLDCTPFILDIKFFWLFHSYLIDLAVVPEHFLLFSELFCSFKCGVKLGNSSSLDDFVAGE
jgi:hypothetical protein